MIVDFDEKDHVYSVNGNIAEISVTELLKKHKLSPSYDKVDKEKLEESARRGKKIHKDLENVLNMADYVPKTPEGVAFDKWVKENLDCGVGEQILGYELEGYNFAGTADVMGIMKDGSLLIADHKTTSVLHRDAVEWQISLLDYFARELGNEAINGKVLKWKGATKFICFHYVDGELKVVDDLVKKSDEEIEKLLNCERKGEIYTREVLAIDPELEQKYLAAEEYLAVVEKTYKEAEEKAKQLRQELLQLFEEQGIKSWESPDKKILVTYVYPMDRISVDSVKLKKNFPEVYTNCQKITKVKSSIRVKIRDEEGDDLW